jgi:hypothetical protein
MYFVESFLRQSGRETDSKGDAFNKDPFTDTTYDRLLTHEYIYRLHNILPCCIDAKMIGNYKSNKKRPKYPSLYYKLVVDEPALRNYLKNNYIDTDEEATTIIEQYKEKKYSTVTELEYMLRSGFVKEVWRYRVSVNGDERKSKDVILDEIVQNYNSYENIRIEETYTEVNRGKIDSTYAGLLSQIDINNDNPEPVDIRYTIKVVYAKTSDPC